MWMPSNKKLLDMVKSIEEEKNNKHIFNNEGGEVDFLSDRGLWWMYC